MTSSRSERRGARKAALQARQRAANRLLVPAVACFAAAVVASTTILVLSVELDLSLVVGLAGSTGVVALVGAALFVRRELVAPRPMGAVGRVGIGFVVLLGLTLLTAEVLGWVSGPEAASLATAVGIVPAVLGIGCLVAEASGGGGGHDDATAISNSMNHIING